MNLKNYIAYVKRGFKAERFRLETIGGADRPEDFCSMLLVEPAEGVVLRSARVVVAGPVPMQGTLRWQDRTIAHVDEVRYSLSLLPLVDADHQKLAIAVPVVGRRASVGMVGVYYTTADGTDCAMLTPEAVTMMRGAAVRLTLEGPAPDMRRDPRGRVYTPPKVSGFLFRQNAAVEK